MNQEVMNLFNQQVQPVSFDQIKISISSPEKILSWSYARSRNPRRSTTAPSNRSGTGCSARGSLGRSRTTSACAGKYKRMKYKGVICEKCGVEVTLARVRRDRMGHIELAAPVAHIWFLKSLPSRIGCCSTWPSRTWSGSSTSSPTASSSRASPPEGAPAPFGGGVYPRAGGVRRGFLHGDDRRRGDPAHPAGTRPRSDR